MEEKKEGIILNTIDYKENHKIIYLLTKEGKESLLINGAKNIKKGQSNETQVLTKVSYIKKGNNLAKATLLESIDYYNEIKIDIKRMAVASYLIEVVYRFIHNDTNFIMLYNLLDKFLEELKIANNLKLLLLEFRIKLLYFLGIEPNFKTCVHCGSKNNLVGLALRFGSMECIEHESKDNIGIYATNIIQLLYKDKTLKINLDDNNVVDYLSDLIDKYYSYHLNDKIKSEKMLVDLNLY